MEVEPKVASTPNPVNNIALLGLRGASSESFPGNRILTDVLGSVVDSSEVTCGQVRDHATELHRWLFRCYAPDPLATQSAYQ